MKTLTLIGVNRSRRTIAAKFAALLSATCAIILAIDTAQAQPTVYEPFNYPLGTFATGTAATGTGLSGNWTCGASGTIVAGLTYPGLPVADNALSSTGSRQYVSFSNAISNGTEWISFLLKTSAGNPGANINGVYFPNGGTGLFFGFGFGPYSPTQGYLGIGSMNTTGNNAANGTVANDSYLGTYGTTYLVVIRIDFNTSGTNDTVSVYIDPPTATNAPGVSPNETYSSMDVGTISGIGLNVKGATTMTIDEINVGPTYGSVVGVITAVAIPTTLSLSVQSGNEISWTATNTDSYQPQSSTDDINWINLGGVLTGSTVTSLFDPASAPYYQILDYTVGGVTNAEPNGSFEIPDVNSTGALDWTGSANNTYNSVYATNSWKGTVLPVNGTNLLYIEGSTAATNQTAPDTYLQSAPFPITGGQTYPVSFSSCNPVTVGGGDPQYRVQYYNTGYGFVGSSGFLPIGAGATWTTISNNFAAPTNAAYMDFTVIQAVGSGASWDWVTLIDNVKVFAALPGPTNVLPATVNPGAVFTATVETNGIPTTLATGSVAFQINGVAAGNGVVSSGVANSPAGIVPASTYTVTAIYPGDGNFAGSTNSLVVSNSVGVASTRLTTSLSGNQLTLSWPSSYTGWSLQSQTNTLGVGLSTNWYTVSGSSASNGFTITINPLSPTVFFRLKSP